MTNKTEVTSGLMECVVFQIGLQMKKQVQRGKTKDHVVSEELGFDQVF